MIAHKIKKIFHKNRTAIYRGKYYSLAEARAHTHEKQTYGNASYDKRALKKFTTHEKYTHGRNMIIPIILSIINQQNWKIIDIGGGVNSVFSHLNSPQKQKTTCHKIERPDIIQPLNQQIPEKHKQNLLYISDLKEIHSGSIDIAYFGSSIQYIENYPLFLENIFKLSPQLIIFSESIFTSEKEDYYVLQQNMAPNIFPNNFISKTKMNTIMHNNGYSPTLELTIPGEHTHKEIHRSEYDCKTLIYKK